MPRGAQLILGIFFAVGLVMLAGAAYSYAQLRAFVAGSAKADGIVIENVRSTSRTRGSSRMVHPRVSFRANGRTVVFTSTVASNPPSFQVEERVQVLYNPENPEDARINSFGELWLLPTILGGMGLVFTSVWTGPFLWQRYARSKDDWLRLNGRRVFADFDRVEVNRNLKVNGRRPWLIVCTWRDPATNEVREFRSRNLWSDPSGLVAGKHLVVLVSPDNPRRYLVETSFLPQP